jgi:hypothetical protein
MQRVVLVSSVLASRFVFTFAVRFQLRHSAVQCSAVDLAIAALACESPAEPEDEPRSEK